MLGPRRSRRVQLGVWRLSACSGHRCGLFCWCFVIWGVGTGRGVGGDTYGHRYRERGRETEREVLGKFKRDMLDLYNNNTQLVDGFM